MRLGFTGTREGMTDVQREGVAEWLRVNRPVVVHHGDCVGADSQFHDSVLLLSTPTWIETHPCDLAKYRANRKADVVHPVKSPKDRNQDIVNVSDCLLAAPRTTSSEPRSGTWQTIRMALKARKTVTFIWPDGSISVQGYTSLAGIFGA
jgi:hypothetical protein